MRVVRADTEDRYEDALAVRFAVFVEEQGVPEDLEVDEHEDDALHFVAYDDAQSERGEGTQDECGDDSERDAEPVGAARLREYEPGVGKVERVAVLDERRGEGWGGALMDAVEDAARQHFGELYLHAQVSAAGFYDARGYEREGDEFEEGGIPHVAMRKPLN